MALIQITADLSRTARALERIADVLDRAFPKQEEPAREFLDVKDLSQVTNWPSFESHSEEEEWRRYGPRSYE